MGLIHGNQLPEGQDEPQHGMAIFAREQTSGKGQRGKNWVSEKDANIVLSILLNPYPLGIQDQFKLSVCVSVSIYEFFSRYAGDETKIKWPNDLYWRDRKAGGILIENVNVVVHVMLEETRKFYKLEEMWSDAVTNEHDEN